MLKCAMLRAFTVSCFENSMDSNQLASQKQLIRIQTVLLSVWIIDAIRWNSAS